MVWDQGGGWAAEGPGACPTLRNCLGCSGPVGRWSPFPGHVEMVSANPRGSGLHSLGCWAGSVLAQVRLRALWGQGVLMMPFHFLKF